MSKLSSIARECITHSPTPLERLTQLSKHLNINLFIKRDDCTGLAGGGNKTRKLEYLIADAKQQGADTIVTVGGIQSNHARQTAAAAAKFGFGCELVLEDVAGTPKQDYYRNGNALLNRLFNAGIHYVNNDESCETVSDALIKKLQQQGRKPYFIPMGGSNALGSLGYVRCANEIKRQAKQLNICFDRIILASGSAGTQAGLLAGLIDQQQAIPVLGICVSRSGTEQEKLVQSLLEETLLFINSDPSLANGKVHANGDYYGEGYGITTEKTRQAIELLAQKEGILLDPVYTGKAMAGLLDLCEKGAFKEGENILFLHTGGSQGLFAYQQEF